MRTARMVGCAFRLASEAELAALGAEMARYGEAIDTTGHSDAIVSAMTTHEARPFLPRCSSAG